MYPTIDEAVADRLALRFGVVGASLAAPLLWQLPLRIGISTDDLRPIDHIARFGAPVLFASGAEDRHTTWSETQRLFNAAVEPKAI